MAERKNTHGLQLHADGEVTVVDIGTMEIWDGADLSLLRDTLNQIILKDRRRSIAIDMKTVKYIPSGFFGMLYDWFEKGITVRLFSPQPRVAGMLWFRRFFEQEADHCFILFDDGVAVDESNEPEMDIAWDLIPDDEPDHPAMLPEHEYEEDEPEFASTADDF